jgi:chemotaxis protein CheZ
MGDTKIDQTYVDIARELAQRLDAGDMEGVERLVDDLTHIRETDLFKELGRLTRELHESLKAFKLDSRISELTEQEIPDARERLNYVISMTEQAAHRTLNAIEDSMTQTEQLTGRARELHERWARFRKRQMPLDEFRDLSRELDGFFEQIESQGGKVQSNLTEALMAQDYQDLTGQVIRRVINLVQEVEDSLVSLVSISGTRMAEESRHAADNKINGKEKGEGPRIPGQGDDAQFVQGQDGVDDLLSSLGF